MVIVPLFRRHRILTQVAGHHMNVVKVLAPLIIEESELRRFVAALEDVLADVESRLLRRYARLGLGLGRRSLTAR
jgi:acetylornithine/succinyldiaminopimelate/putrescine aminotransferase